MHIALLGDLEDLASVYLGWLAETAGGQVMRLPEDTLGQDWWFAYDDSDGGGELRVGEHVHDLSAFDGFFVRLHPHPKLPHGVVLDDVQRHVFIIERRDAIYHFLESLACPVVNRPTAGRSNASKPLQMEHLEKAGFRVPRWLVSNTIESVTAFVREAPAGAVYKAVSGLRARVRRADEHLLARLTVGTAPVLVQDYVPGKDVRIHTVGPHAFATEVIGPGVDYRFESEGTQYDVVEAPDPVARLCCETAAQEGLLLAGFDFRVSPEGEWYCLEMNPAPSFLPYEFSSGVPIGSTILSLFGTPQ